MESISDRLDTIVPRLKGVHMEDREIPTISIHDGAPIMSVTVMDNAFSMSKVGSEGRVDIYEIEAAQ